MINKRNLISPGGETSLGSVPRERVGRQNDAQHILAEAKVVS